MPNGKELRQFLMLFATGLVLAAGQKLGEYLVARLTAVSPGTATGVYTGRETTTLCPHCGRMLIRYSRTLYCARCGYREN